jgi:hypothetical protein
MIFPLPQSIRVYHLIHESFRKTNSDLKRMLAGGGRPIVSIWCDGNKLQPYQWANREMDTVLAWTSRNPH